MSDVQPPGIPVVAVRAGAATDSGSVRERNEDAYLLRSPVFLVADGMGGHHGGAEASAIVVEEFARDLDTWLTPADVHQALVRATGRISALSHETGATPGSTVSGVGLTHQHGVAYWLVLNVGDSRTYRLSNGALELVTVDHTRVQEWVDAGRLSADEARRHGQRNVITRAVGGGLRHTPQADLWLIPVGPHDRLLVCSDGLTGEVTEQLIAATLIAHPDAERAAAELVRQAVAAGGRDNVTALVVDVVEVANVGQAPAADADDTCPDLAVVAAGGDTLPGVSEAEVGL